MAVSFSVELYVSADGKQPEGRQALAMLTVETMKRGVATGIYVVMPFYAPTEQEARDNAERWLKAEQARAAEVRANIELAEQKRAEGRRAKVA